MPSNINISRILQNLEHPTTPPVPIEPSQFPVELARERLSFLARLENEQYLNNQTTKLNALQTRLDNVRSTINILRRYFGDLIAGNTTSEYTTSIGPLPFPTLTGLSRTDPAYANIFLTLRQLMSMADSLGSDLFELRQGNYEKIEELLRTASQGGEELPLNVTTTNLSEFTIRDFRGAMREILEASDTELQIEPITTFINLFLTTQAKEIIERR